MLNTKPYWDNAADIEAGTADILQQNWNFPTGEYVERGLDRAGKTRYQRVTYLNGGIVEAHYNDDATCAYKVTIPNIGVHQFIYIGYIEDERHQRCLQSQTMSYPDGTATHINYVYQNAKIMGFEITEPTGLRKIVSTNYDREDGHYIENDEDVKHRFDNGMESFLTSNCCMVYKLSNNESYYIGEDVFNQNGLELTFRLSGNQCDKDIIFRNDGSVTRTLEPIDENDYYEHLEYGPTGYRISGGPFDPDKFWMPKDDVQPILIEEESIYQGLVYTYSLN